MEGGKVSLLPPAPQRADAAFKSVPSVISIEGLMWSVGECDALCVDDRFTNGHPVATDTTGRAVPVVCILDVLRYLRSGRVVSDEEYWAARHKLRDAGFGFMPVEAEELLNQLLDAEFEEGRLLESAELRTIRQTVNRADALQLLKDDEAHTLSQGLISACVEVIRTLWLDASISADVAATLSTWVWRYLPVSTFLISEEAMPNAPPTALEEVVSRRLGLLMLAPMMDSTERRSAYRKWLERSVLAPLRSASPELIEDAASIVCETVAHSPAEYREMVGALFLECLPNDLQERIVKEDPKFASDCGFGFRSVLGIAGRVRVEEAALVQAAQALFEGAGMQALSDVDGVEVQLDLGEDDIPRLTWTAVPGSQQEADIPELTLIGENAVERANVAEKILERLGPSVKGETRALLEDAGSRRLSVEELSSVFGEETTGVAAGSVSVGRKDRFRLAGESG